MSQLVSPKKGLQVSQVRPLITLCNPSQHLQGSRATLPSFETTQQGGVVSVSVQHQHRLLVAASMRSSDANGYASRSILAALQLHATLLYIASSTTLPAPTHLVQQVSKHADRVRVFCLCDAWRLYFAGQQAGSIHKKLWTPVR